MGKKETGEGRRQQAKGVVEGRGKKEKRIKKWKGDGRGMGTRGR